jgi:hypothetical protein
MDIGSKFPGIASLNGGNNFTVYYKTANVFTIRFFNEFLTNMLAFKLLNALITLSAAFFCFRKNDSFSCVPSSIFTSGNRLPF